MNKVRNRLTLIFILFIGLSNLAAGIFTVSVLRDSQVRSLEDSLEEQLKLYLATVDWETVFERSVRGEAYGHEAARIARKAGARVTFFDRDGAVLGDSAKGTGPGEEPGQVPKEIVLAGSQGFGTDIRASGNDSEKIMYVALPASFGDSGVGFVRFGASMNHLDAETFRITSYLLVGLLVLLLMTALISYRISQGLTGPLEKITRVAYQITNLNYKARVSIQNRDEIGQLGQAINTMAESLQFQMNRIQEDESRLKSVLENMLSGVVMIDRDERIVLINRSAEEMLGMSAAELLGQKYNVLKAQYELIKMIGECEEKHEHIRDEIVFYYPEERTLDIHLVPMTGAGGEFMGIVIVFHDISAIRRLERMRSEFVANVSHELKTPIAAVKGFAETLLGGAVNDPETAKSFLQIIYDESERLDRLIGDILDLSKIESKRVQLHFSPVEMKPFIERTLNMMSTEAAKKNIQLESNVEEDIYVEADEDRLRQILINLLANGISYTHEGGSVKITVEPVTASGTETGSDAEYEKIRIIVQDTGIGIPRKDLPRIFERFYRVDKARTRASGGTGLGLSIVKHLVELHKGTIRVDSIVGAGSKFVIELPVLQ
ncbi:two-component system histidine kinase PnpS [Paenibacillus alkalitolerans]|uniref:two-component system histidine kinase PnpS n=1 Tax=Paenibacillus alkalitolerans TaxID=2799335 RepID=UPI0018F58C07|nr:HAMP domain-containing sensor histidine kinase [Paenibacillus alkalitolerans]